MAPMLSVSLRVFICIVANQYAEGGVRVQAASGGGRWGSELCPSRTLSRLRADDEAGRDRFRETVELGRSPKVLQSRPGTDTNLDSSRRKGTAPLGLDRSWQGLALRIASE